MFRLAPVATMKRTVTVRVPDAEIADKVNEQQFVAHYRVMTREEIAAFDAARDTLSMDEKLRDPHAFHREILIGWDKVVDPDGKPVPFSKEALEAALEYPWFAGPVYEEYRRGLSGEPRLGN